MMPLDAEEAQTLKMLSETTRGITHNPWKREMELARMTAGYSRAAQLKVIRSQQQHSESRGLGEESSSPVVGT